jgi:hypothetical protein
VLFRGGETRLGHTSLDIEYLAIARAKGLKEDDDARAQSVTAGPRPLTLWERIAEGVAERYEEAR